MWALLVGVADAAELIDPSLSLCSIRGQIGLFDGADAELEFHPIEQAAFEAGLSMRQTQASTTMRVGWSFLVPEAQPGTGFSALFTPMFGVRLVWDLPQKSFVGAGMTVVMSGEPTWWFGKHVGIGAQLTGGFSIGEFDYGHTTAYPVLPEVRGALGVDLR